MSGRPQSHLPDQKCCRAIYNKIDEQSVITNIEHTSQRLFLEQAEQNRLNSPCNLHCIYIKLKKTKVCCTKISKPGVQLDKDYCP